MTRKFLITGLLLPVFFMGLQAQPEGQANGSVSGVVVDNTTQLPVEYANIVVLTRDSAVVNGSVTSGEGLFTVRNIPYGRYLMRVTFLGYEELWIDTVMLNHRNRHMVFDQIQLTPSSVMLENVQVTAQRSVLEMQIDRRVFNVDQSVLTQGQSASEVLETVPSVEVDMDGNVSLRGSGNVTILIDGRPSALMGSDVAAALQQIPAEMIESIELITNPSARYDPEGMAGIINIKLRKDRRGGLNGTVTAGYGTREKYNTSLNLNYRTERFNLFTNYSLNHRDFFRNGTTWTVNRQNPDSLHYTDQFIDMNMYRRSHMARVGADWFINSKNTLSAFYTYNTNTRVSDEIVTSEYLDHLQNPSRATDRYSDNDASRLGHDVVLNWQRTFNREGQELNVDANYSVSQNNSASWYTDVYRLLNYQPSDRTMEDNRFGYDESTIASLQADYTHPLSNNRRFETGFRFGYRMIDSDQDANIYDTLQLDWVPDSLRINRFIYDEYIYAGYFTYGGRLNKFNYQAGLRFEHTTTGGDLVTTDEQFSNRYPALFPTLHLSYKPGKNLEFQISYSRRINRPRSRALNPFANYSDPMNIRQGNPYLEPEFTHSMEAGFARFFEKSSLMGSIFYRETSDQIGRFKVIQPDGTTIMTFRNLSKGITYGYELVGTYNPFRWWTMNATFNMSERILDADQIQEGLRNRGLMWSARYMSTFTLTTGTSIQMTGYYSSPRILTIGTSAPRYGFDMGVRHSVLKNRGTISLRVSDIFYTSSWIMSLDGQGFSQEIERYFNSRVAYLTFSYQFGQQVRDQQSRRRSMRNQQNGDDNGGGDVMF